MADSAAAVYWQGVNTYRDGAAENRAHALPLLARAVDLFRQAGDRVGEGAALGDIGDLHRELGRLDSALVYTAQALAVYQQAEGERGREGVGIALRGVGMLHSALGRPDSALVYYVRNLELQKGLSLQGVAFALTDIGEAHQLLGRLDSALVYYAQALAAHHSQEPTAGEGGTLSAMGTVYAALNQPDSALVYYARALPILRKREDRWGEGVTLRGIGEVHRTLGRMDAALEHYARALAIAREVGDLAGEGATLSNIGSAHRSSKRPDLSRATAYYDSAATVKAQIAASAGGDQNRLSFAEQDVRLFSEWALTWLARAPEVGPRQAALAGWAASERGRSQALLDLMHRSAGREGLRVPAPGGDLVREGEQLIRAVTNSGAAVLSFLATSDTLLAWIALPDGTVRVHRTPVLQDSLAAAVHAFRSALSVDSAAVRARMLMRESPSIEAIPSEQDQSRSDRRLRRPHPAGDWRERSQYLSALLLPPELLGGLPPSAELVVVPHGATNLVPFSALMLSDGEYLGTRHALRYAPSLSSLAEARRARGANSPRTALVVGNPTMPSVATRSGERVHLSPLPGAATEGQWVAKQLGTSSVSGARATEGFVRELLPKAEVVHLATHGYAYSSEERARDSFIALAPDSHHDGLFTVGEVLDGVATLAADLVVLSACQTGLGELKHAEGTVGLQRAFMAKGARSVLVSLWSVSDDATELLMRRFYTHWLQDDDRPSKTEALRRAQEDVKTDATHPEWAHPRYWAAFQLVGAR